jgi:hypothetical protein
MKKNKIIIRLKGGLGNQLFIYSYGFSFIKKNYDLLFDLKTGFFFDYYNRKPRLSELINDLKLINITHIFIYYFTKKYKKVANLIFKSIIITESQSNVLLDINENDLLKKYIFIEGYFQSLNYFYSYKSDLYNKIEFPELIKQQTSFFSERIINSNSVSIHVRRKQYDNHLPSDYYYKAIDIVLNKVKDSIFFIFSDDHDWCKKNLPNTANYVFVEGFKDELCDLYLMSLCKCNIIANSSFSWWGAWLTNKENKIVIAPINTQIGVSDYFYPDNWIRI